MKYYSTILTSLIAINISYAQQDYSKTDKVREHAIESEAPSRPRIVKAKKTINVYTKMTSGSLKCIAGEAIILRPGFSVVNGAQFHAIIQDVEGEGNAKEDARIGNQEILDENELSINTYPNPFVKKMEIEYWLPESSKVSLSVYNGRGILIARLINNTFQDRGLYKIDFDPGQLSPGVYTCVLDTPSSRKAHKVVKH